MARRAAANKLPPRRALLGSPGEAGTEAGLSSLSVGKAWDESVQFIRRERRLVGPVALAFYFLPALFVRWAYPSGAGAGALWLGMAQMIAVLAGFLAIAALALGAASRVGEALALAGRRLGRVILAFLIAGIPLTIILIVLILVLGGSSLESGMTAEQMAANPAFRQIMLIALVLVGVVGSRLYPIWGQAVTGEESAMGLLKRAWSLSSGHSLKLLGIVVGLLLMGVIAQQAAVWSIGSVAIVAFGKPAAFSLSALLMALAGAAVGAVFAVINSVLAAHVFAQLAGRERQA